MTNIIYDTSQDADFEKMFDMSVHTGIIREIYTADDTARVDIADLGGEFDHVDIFYHCPNSGDILGGSAAFSIDDEVVVINEKGKCAPDVANLKIIGFADKKLRLCGEYLVIRLYSTPLSYDKTILWDIAANACAAGVRGDDGNIITSWPADTNNLDNWFDAHDQQPPQDLLKDLDEPLPGPAHINTQHNLSRLSGVLSSGVVYQEDYDDVVDIPGIGVCHDTISCGINVECTEGSSGTLTCVGSGDTSLRRWAGVRGGYESGVDALSSRAGHPGIGLNNIFGSGQCNPNNACPELQSFFTKIDITEQGSKQSFETYEESRENTCQSTGDVKYTTVTPWGELAQKILPYTLNDYGFCELVFEAGEYRYTYNYFLEMDYLYDSSRKIKSGYTDRSLSACFLYIYGVGKSFVDIAGVEQPSSCGVGVSFLSYAGPINLEATAAQTYEKPTFGLHAICAPDEDPEHKNPFDLPRNPQLETAIGAMVQQFIDLAYDAGSFDDGEFPPISFTYNFRR